MTVEAESLQTSVQLGPGQPETTRSFGLFQSVSCRMRSIVGPPIKQMLSRQFPAPPSCTDRRPSNTSAIGFSEMVALLVAAAIADGRSDDQSGGTHMSRF